RCGQPCSPPCVLKRGTRLLGGTLVLCRVMRDRSLRGDLRPPTADRGMKMQLAWRVRCITLMSVTEIRPAANAYPARWLLRSDVDWRGLVRYGPPGFLGYVRIAPPHYSRPGAGQPPGKAPTQPPPPPLTPLRSCP